MEIGDATQAAQLQHVQFASGHLDALGIRVGLGVTEARKHLLVALAVRVVGNHETRPALVPDPLGLEDDRSGSHLHGNARGYLPMGSAVLGFPGNPGHWRNHWGRWSGR